MKSRLINGINITLSAFKYLLAVSMMLSGIQTIFGPTQEVAGAVGVIYSSHIILTLFGLYFLAAGIGLFYGKITRRRRIVGYSLMMIYLAYLFATIIQFLAGLPWIVNLVMTVVVGLLYLRWKYQKFYSVPTVRNPDDRNGESTVHV